MKVAVVGATGLVGSVMLKVLKERNFPVSKLIPVASSRSIGKNIRFGSEEIAVVSWEDALAQKPEIALFSAGGETSKELAPIFADAGSYVIDNSSAWRMESGIPLVVPEINGDLPGKDNHIIANPNCSTIQLVMILAPLHKKYGIERIVVSTYQSITGTGIKAVEQMNAEREGRQAEMVYPHKIDRNCLPHCDEFLENGYTKEEVKIVNETRKILDDESINITATSVRIPVTGGHSESVNLSFNNEFDVDEVRGLLRNTPGVVVQDDPAKNEYPMPLTSEGKDDVFVGRIRRDESFPNSLNLWIVSDNLRKGAATNAVQIAEKLLQTVLKDVKV